MNAYEMLGQVQDALRAMAENTEATAAQLRSMASRISIHVMDVRTTMLPPPLPAGTRVRINDPPQPGVDREERRFRGYEHGDEGFIEGRSADGRSYRIEINGRSGVIVHVTDLEVIL